MTVLATTMGANTAKVARPTIAAPRPQPCASAPGAASPRNSPPITTATMTRLMQGFLRGGARDVKARRVKGLRAVR